MLTQLDRYILRQLLASLAAVTAALVALIWLTQSLRFVELVVNRGLSMRVFLELTSLIGPEGYIKDRLAAYKESGVTLLNIAPLQHDQVDVVAKIKDWAA